MPESVNIASLERCRCLRSKEMFVQVEPDASVQHFGSGIFWCTHTQNCLGPDGQAAEPESCKSGRACYEAL